MFEDFYDSWTMLFSRWWPETAGEITDFGFEKVLRRNGEYTLRLLVAYKFSVGTDGPFTGESSWSPSWLVSADAFADPPKLRPGQAVTVRYRRDDPSVNRLDHKVWNNL